MTEVLSHKADLALSQLVSNGGLLTPEQNDTFIRKLIDAPTMLRLIRSVPMNNPEIKLNKIGFGSRILRAASQTGTAEDNGTNGRYLAKADRSAPTTSQINMTTKEIIAEVRIPYEVLEDNIERGNLETTILSLIAERAALDLEELIVLGDSASGDAYLALVDGYLKRATVHVVDAAGRPIDLELWNDVKKALPTKYRRNLTGMRIAVHPDVESDYRVKMASRGTQLGDALATGSAPLPIMGTAMVAAAMMPLANSLFTDPQNLLFGIQRNVRIEMDKDIRSREIIIVLTCRVGTQIEETDALVKVINLGQ